MTDTIEELKNRYRRFADVECGEYGALYFRLSHAVASDIEILQFISEMTDRQPNLFFAAMHYLAGSEDVPSNADELSLFVRNNRDALAVVMRTHHTQTNEVGRCAAILPALPEGPIALIEVGSSAGLCLMLDKFLYDYGAFHVGDEESNVVLRCNLETEAPLPRKFPEIVWRRGLDTEPVDVNDVENVRWLLACVWPDHVERRQRLKSAIEMCQQNPVRINKGDMVADLPTVIAEAPREGLLVIFHSAVFPYIAADRRAAFPEVLSKASQSRDIVWLSNEAPGMIPELDTLAPGRDRLRFLLGRTYFSKRRASRELLALSHPHGWDLEWLS